MVAPALLLGFAITALIIELTPGPNMAWLALLSATEGRKAGLAATAGIAVGLLLIAAVSALGLAALIDNHPAIYETLRWAGALFLLYLAWEGWRAAGESSPASTRSGAARHAWRGFVINALNPKAAFFFVTVLPEFVSPAMPAAPQTITLALTSVTIATLIHLALVLMAGSIQAFIADEARNRLTRRILSLALVAVAIWLFISAAR
ncbi:LysE family translocator [Hyphobacterium sp.]|uniref:LysE family translocator n=1 Tax=Hyphobacterium sp. TaxID=2004662 RepID=UPI003747E801